MKAQDLRIGNLVLFAEDQTLFTVGEISETGIVVQNENETTWIELIEFEPIPLTEEWLKKFGFKYQDRDVSHNRGKIERFFIYDWIADGDNWSLEINLVPRLKANGFFWLLWNIGGGKEFVHLPHTCKLEFVHQLQNFIYCLTGTELTIK